MWDNYEDARMRCSGSVVRYEGKPIYIHEVTGDLHIKFTSLLSQRQKTVKLDDPKIDWKPVPAGFVNTGGTMAYVCRRPVRKWKQGLHRDNIHVVEGDRRHRLRYADLLRSREFGRCAMRDYPKFDNAMEAVAAGKDAKSKVLARAFSPEFGLTRTELGLVWLVYRGDRVGWYEKGHLRLGEGKEYLIQSYEEAVA